MPSLKEQTIKGIAWTAFQKVGTLAISFIANIILARLLSPEDFGCIGILLVFTSLADVLVDGGLGNAIIQKQDTQDKDYATVFVSNLFLSILLFATIFIAAPHIAYYFQIPLLKTILRVEAIAIILRALYIVQFSLLEKRMQFRTITVTMIYANIISVLLAVFAANKGLGVWSLVIKNVLLQASLCLLFWLKGGWKVQFRFDITSFKTLYDYGFKVALSNFIEMLASNIQSFIIGKRFKSVELGYYSQSKSLSQIPIYSISMVVNQVLFPSLSKLQANRELMIKGIRKSLIAITYVAFPVILLMCILAEPLILFLFTEKWLQSVPYLQLICISGLVNSVLHTNYTILKSSGDVNYFLIVQVILNTLLFMTMLVGMNYGVKGILWGHIIGIYIGCFILSLFSKKAIGYGPVMQSRDIVPALIVGIFSSIPVLAFKHTHCVNNILLMLVVSVLIYLVCYVGLSIIFKLKGLNIYVGILKNKYK